MGRPPAGGGSARCLTTGEQGREPMLWGDRLTEMRSPGPSGGDIGPIHSDLVGKSSNNLI